MDFYFKTQKLKLADYESVQVIALKEYNKKKLISI